MLWCMLQYRRVSHYFTHICERERWYSSSYSYMWHTTIGMRFAFIEPIIYSLSLSHTLYALCRLLCEGVMMGCAFVCITIIAYTTHACAAPRKIAPMKMRAIRASRIFEETVCNINIEGWARAHRVFQVYEFINTTVKLEGRVGGWRSGGEMYETTYESTYDDDGQSVVVVSKLVSLMRSLGRCIGNPTI